MTVWDDFLKNPDIERIILIEIKVGKEIEGENWTATGNGSYWMDWDPAVLGEVLEVKENGNAYSKKGNVADVDSTASSFYQDWDEKKLYIHTSGGDSPDSKDEDGKYKYCIIASFWRGFVNRQYEGEEILFIPEGGSKAIYYLPFFEAEGLNIRQGVGDYWIGNIVLQSGVLRFRNSGWWYKRLEEEIWHNREVLIKIGGKGFQYGDFKIIFQGKSRNPEVEDEGVLIEVVDSRMADFKNIPLRKFWTSDYPNLEEGAEGQVIPVVFGEVHGITPICVDKVAHKYKVCDYEIEDILKVYKDGEETTDFTKDLGNGEFTLNFDPGNAHITCDVKGVKCGSGGVYSENVADILLFVLKELNGLTDDDFDIDSFDDLRTARTQAFAWYLDREMRTLDFVRLLQASGVFHLLPTPEGKYGAYRYIYSNEGDKKIYQEDIKRVKIRYNSEGVYNKVVVKYNRNPTNGEWNRVEVSETKTEYRYNEKKTLIIETALRVKDEAEALGKFYLKLTKNPGKVIEGIFPFELVDLRPAQKIEISKKIESDEEGEITVFEKEVYRILELNKDVGRGIVNLRGLLDLQASAVEHADSPHEDSHADSHSDEAHQDEAHQDSGHADWHSDEAHQDSHSDEAHQDSHVDGYQDEVGNPHLDKYMDSYSDEAHQDSHSDEAHQDSHGDASHQDEAHEDEAHEDSHEDEHGDEAHGDGEF